MSALHRAWLADQAAALEYRRCMAELDAYANPSEPVRSAAQELRAALREQRETRQQPRDKHIPFKRSGHPCEGESAKAASVPDEAARSVASNNYVK